MASQAEDPIPLGTPVTTVDGNPTMPNILSECDYSPGQINSVPLTNWSNHKIYRAGITPVHDDGLHKWIGLGISRYNAAIVPIGGTIELTDHDLLTTAVREYNEEIGSNMPNLTESDVYHCYAIQSNYYISIILPVKSRCLNFIPTEELHSILWITPKQLRIMATHRNFILYGAETSKVKKSGSRGFAFGSGLMDLVPILTATVEFGHVFNPATEGRSFERPIRPQFVAFPRVISDIQVLIRDASSMDQNWYHVAYVQTPNFVGLMLQDGTFYKFPIGALAQILLILSQRGVPLYTATASDLRCDGLPTFQPQLIKPITQLIKPITQLINKIKGTESIRTDFETQLHQIRSLVKMEKLDLDEEAKALYLEARLITKYEVFLYKLAYNQGTFFNRTRANFLGGINLINAKLASTHRILYGRLIKTIRTEYKGSQPSISTILNIMLNVGLLQQSWMGVELDL